MNAADALSQYGLGVSYAAMGEYGQAFTVLKEALRLAPDDAMTLCSFGALLHRMGDLEGAMEYFRCVQGLGCDLCVPRQSSWLPCARTTDKIDVRCARIPKLPKHMQTLPCVSNKRCVGVVGANTCFCDVTRCAPIMQGDLEGSIEEWKIALSLDDNLRRARYGTVGGTAFVAGHEASLTRVSQVGAGPVLARSQQV